MFVLRGELPKSDRVVIVDIDEKSLKAYGQWPWQRDVVSELLYSLTDAGGYYRAGYRLCRGGQKLSA